MKTLREQFLEASNNLQLFPLQTTEEINKFGVKYDTNTLIDLQQRIEDNPDNSKIILSGHTGCGKSTLLATLAHDYKDKFFVCIFSIAETIENSDVNYVNILFAIGLKLLETSKTLKIPVSTSVEDDLIKWFAKTTKVKEASFKSEAGVGVNLLELLALKLKVDAGFRQEIKQEFLPKVSELSEKLNQITAIVESLTNKKVLVIIDDIDKLDLKIVYEIFHNNIKSLFLPSFRILYTLPITALHDAEILPVLQNETGDQIVTMRVLKLYAKGETHKDHPTPQQKTVETLTRILRLRLDREIYLDNPDSESKLIDSEAIAQLALYSGGVLRELIRLAKECCRVCLLDLRRNPDTNVIIDLDILERAVNNLRIQMARTLGRDKYEILSQVKQNYIPDDPQNHDFFQLLKGLQIIEYRNDREWFDLHPIIDDLLREWEKNDANNS